MLKRVFLYVIANFMAVLIISAALHRVIPTYFYISILALPISGALAFLQFKFFLREVNFESHQVAKLVLSLFIASSSLLSFSFHSTVPLNVDRSFTVWMINQLGTNPQVNKLTQVEENAAIFFSPKGGEIARRVNEQVSLGNMKNKDGVISLTSRGKRIWRINRIVSTFFGLNTKYSG